MLAEKPLLHQTGLAASANQIAALIASPRCVILSRAFSGEESAFSPSTRRQLQTLSPGPVEEER
jgi:hypothetical protein